LFFFSGGASEFTLSLLTDNLILVIGCIDVRELKRHGGETEVSQNKNDYKKQLGWGVKGKDLGLSKSQKLEDGFCRTAFHTIRATKRQSVISNRSWN
jgi:hypothetical protein